MTARNGATYDISNRVLIADHELPPLEALLQHAEESLGFLEIAFLGVGNVLLGVLVEVTHLALLMTTKMISQVPQP